MSSKRKPPIRMRHEGILAIDTLAVPVIEPTSKPMISQLFSIKSLWVQNVIMLLSIGVVAVLLMRAVLSRSFKRLIVFGIWVLIVLGFFNSPFFGFSAVRVFPSGIGLEYGILSFRNTTLPLSSPWKIESYLGGIRKNKRLYAIRIGDRESMRVKGERERELLHRIGEAIEQARNPSSGRPTG